MRRINIETVDSESEMLETQGAEELVFRRPSNPGELPRVTGVNIMTTRSNFQEIIDNLKDMGIEVVNTVYANYPEGPQALFIYAMTMHGQYVLIELPQGTTIQYGDVEIHHQRVQVLQTNIQEIFQKELKGIYTGYAFICAGGIHYVRNLGNEPVVYGYDEYKTAKSILELKSYCYSLIPAVQYIKLAKPERFNTIEAAINTNNRFKVAQDLIRKTGLVSLLTMKGPFTFFLPKESRLKALANYSPEKLRANLLAHIIVGRIEPVDSDDKVNYQAIAGNIIQITRSNEKITKVVSDKKSSNINTNNKTDVIRKYNGIIYITDSVFKPVNENFKMPMKSDLDDIITIFDINKSTMEIRRAQYTINIDKQQQSLKLLEFIGDFAKKLHAEVREISEKEGGQLLNDSNEFMKLFYTRQIPCQDECLRMDKLAEDVRRQNIRFEKILSQSNILGSLKVPLEKFMLKVSRIDRSLNHNDGSVG